MRLWSCQYAAACILSVPPKRLHHPLCAVVRPLAAEAWAKHFHGVPWGIPGAPSECLLRSKNQCRLEGLVSQSLARLIRPGLKIQSQMQSETYLTLYQEHCWYLSKWQNNWQCGIIQKTGSHVSHVIEIMKSCCMQLAAQTAHAFLGRLRLYRLWIALALIGLLRITKRVLRWFLIRLNHLMFARQRSKTLCVSYHLTLIEVNTKQKVLVLPASKPALKRNSTRVWY